MTDPRISVIIPVRGDWALLPPLLDRLAAQTLPAATFEIILVNNDEAPAPPLPASPLPILRVDGPGPGSYAARNSGALAARGDLLVFTDADCLPDPGWLAALDRAQVPGHLLAGPVRMIALPDPGPCAIYDLLRGIPQARYVARGYAATANLAVPARIFRALGGFDPARRSGGDAEFCRRATRAGYRLKLVKTAVVAHPARADWPALATKARRIKGGQITAGPLPRRLAWALRTLSPPLRDILAYARAEAPARWRLIAAAVRLRIWGVELAETVRLIAGGVPERR